MKNFDYTLSDLKKLSDKEYKKVWNHYTEDSVYSSDKKLQYLNSEVKELAENTKTGFYLYTDYYRFKHRRFKEGQSKRNISQRIKQQISTGQDRGYLVIDIIPYKLLKEKDDNRIRKKMYQISKSRIINEGAGQEWIEIESMDPKLCFRKAYELEFDSIEIPNEIRKPYTTNFKNSPANQKALNARINYIKKCKKEGKEIIKYQILKHCGTRKTMDIYKSMDEKINNNFPSMVAVGCPFNQLLNQHHTNFVEEDKALGKHNQIAYLGIASKNIVDRELSPDLKEEYEKDLNIDLIFHNFPFLVLR